MTATANSAALHSAALRAPFPTLTRRGRVLLLGVPALLLTLAMLIAAVFAGAALMNQVQASTTSSAGVEAEIVTVSAGDTLWSLASAADTGTEVQVLITQIAELNDLDSSQLTPGQELYIPVD
ncbi:LysM peptidoglycan-binding domain-containing protein [Nesterenkonia sphaerica]|uniref:LysM peptidoglycan-binding domain-containing protein n=1 Tax=Nesterenkonia sphaerica TaxID=1804988 RepID=A0A5R9ABX1_9MICC|nr:LysM peptidoglycan-binding domain-containing protein [Nesterenkonia sphaerica]TLP75505.1 LysM peptidoglycan-binding domain-containing protein [Nesterenkonia sphaerica]